MRKRGIYPEPTYHDAQDRRFMQIVRQAGHKGSNAVNLLGIPFDGAVLGRKGAAQGPAAMRRAMAGFSNYNVELGVGLEDARIFDLGDLVLRNRDVVKAHSEMENEVLADLEKGSLLVIIGGDNSISLPSLRACSRKFGNLGLVVIDSHFDLREGLGGKPTSGSSYGLALETIEGLDPLRVVEIGIHGFLNSRRYYEKAQRLGVTVVTAREAEEEGAEETAKRAYKVALEGADAVYVSFDLDALDMAYASGVSAPSAGGLKAETLFGLMYQFGRRDRVVAADIVELAPALDSTGRSERTAAAALVYLAAGYESRS